MKLFSIVSMSQSLMCGLAYDTGVVLNRSGLQTAFELRMFSRSHSCPSCGTKSETQNCQKQRWNNVTQDLREKLRRRKRDWLIKFIGLKSKPTDSKLQTLIEEYLAKYLDSDMPEYLRKFVSDNYNNGNMELTPEEQVVADMMQGWKVLKMKFSPVIFFSVAIAKLETEARNYVLKLDMKEIDESEYEERRRRFTLVCRQYTSTESMEKMQNMQNMTAEEKNMTAEEKKQDKQ